MRIAYCTNVRLPSERAHGHQIAKVVKALTEMGHTVEVFVPFRKNAIKESFESYYGLATPVPLHSLGSIDGIAAWWAPGVLGLMLTTALFKRTLKKTLAMRRKDFDLLYTRTPEILSSVTGHNVPVIVELHKIPSRGRTTFLRQLRSCRLIVALTRFMHTELLAMGVSNATMIVEGDAMDLRDFASLPAATDTRRSFHVPLDVPLIVYAGQLSSMGLSKGIPELLGALEILHSRGFHFHAIIAGGPEVERERCLLRLPEKLRTVITFTGHLPHYKIPSLLTAADVLVYPAPASTHPYYLRDTSPLKLFEYMASGRPVVAAELPPLRDIADETMLFFVPPGNKAALADGIHTVLSQIHDAGCMALRAKSHVQRFTWNHRMQRILEAARLTM